MLYPAELRAHSLCVRLGLARDPCPFGIETRRSFLTKHLVTLVAEWSDRSVNLG